MTLPSGTVALVDPAGVSTAADLQVPSDPARVGWWTGGALAGEPFGSVVLAGHVDSWQFGVGTMAELLSAKVGSDVVLADGSEQVRYRIVSTDLVAKARLVTDSEPFGQDVGHRLVLITCGGEFDEITRSYTDNLVVVAVPVG